MAERFYTNSALSTGSILLQGAEAHHLTTVCRFQPGDQVILFNGDGQEYLAELVETRRKEVSLDILTAIAPKREVGFRLEVVAPLPKGDRADFLIEKLTELGVTDFVPLRTERSVVHPRDTKLERLQRNVIEACKQCGRNVLMKIHPLHTWLDYCRFLELPPLKLVAHPGGRAMRDENSISGVCIAVGPEGGFTDEEIQQATAAGWHLIGLGPRILRIETAAIVISAKIAAG
jgi:16S rRNA (uracil1498-N3)-methyltransferase